VSLPRPEPEYVRAEIRRALAADPLLAELGIDALVLAATIVLHGCVTTVERRERAASVVRQLFPNHAVRNELVLSALEPTAAPEAIR
jgi:hypothetical protein